MSNPLVLRGGLVVDSSGARKADVLVVDGVIAEVGATISPASAADVLDCSGCVVGPGLVDLHSHLREPGDPEAETIETGSRAARAGGYTAVIAMPNTEPAIDSLALVEQVRRAAAVGALCQVEPAAAITIGRAGQALVPFAELAAAGVRLFTDDGAGVQDAGLMRRALEYARPLGITLAQHCEDSSLAGGGQMHEGCHSSRMGVPGMPALAEEAMVARDLDLLRLTGGRLHFLHLSTARSLELVTAARQEGLAVTCEVAPHHLLLSDESVAGFDPVFKVNPPLRPMTDVQSLQVALRAGRVDAVATDHAPHAPQTKEAPFAEAPPGMLGLETCLSVVLEVLDPDGSSAVEDVAAMALTLLSWQPAQIVGLTDQGGHIQPGGPANLCVFDPAETWVVDGATLASTARNTPYAGRELRGRVRHTVFQGEAVVSGGEARR